MAYRVIRRSNETFRLRKCRNSYKGHLRLFDILSQYRLTDLMAAGGEGTQMAREIRRTLAVSSKIGQGLPSSRLLNDSVALADEA
jgi:hypothetical protein